MSGLITTDQRLVRGVGSFATPLLVRTFHLRGMCGGVALLGGCGVQTMKWRYISREERKVRRAALKMKRRMFSFRIMSTGAITRANDMLLLRHHLGSYQDRRCGTR